jgi:hypothetical protein
MVSTEISTATSEKIKNIFARNTVCANNESAIDMHGKTNMLKNRNMNGSR